MEEFERNLTQVLAQCVEGFEGLTKAERLSGGASQETYRLKLVVSGEPKILAMRRAAGGVTENPDGSRPGLEIEAKIFQVARDAGVPEPEIIHVLKPEEGLGLGFIMEWLDGETLGARILKVPELEEIRPKLAFECGQILARIHAIDTKASGLDQDLGTVSTEQFIRMMWEQYKLFKTPQPMIDYTARWLLANIPETKTYALVHNDFRNGNIMVTPEGINAVLDWEVAHIGDPIRDLGWICTNSWRFGRTEKEVGGFGDLDDLLAGYRDVSGVDVPVEHVRYWEVFGSFWWAVGCLKMADGWRNGPDQTVERPGIARRSSECQVDCATLIIPGPVSLVSNEEPMTSLDAPRTDELLISVRDFLRNDVRADTNGRTNFMALVGSNSLDIVLRELTLSPAHMRAEQDRLEQILGRSGDLMELRWALTEGLRDETYDLDHPGLADHLRQTVVNQLAIDQPKYSGLANALAHSN